MKTAAALAAASAALASAQIVYNNNTGQYECKKAGSYCVGDSMKTDIIIHCDQNLQGSSGRCEDNLAGVPPMSVYTALCYQSSPDAGDAACEKNCVLYGDSTTTLPASICTPQVTGSGTPTTTMTSMSVTTMPGGQITSTSIPTLPGGEITSTTTNVETETTTVCPETTSTPVAPETSTSMCASTSTFMTVTSMPGSKMSTTPLPPNGTSTSAPSSPSPSATTSASSVPTAGAAANRAGGALAALGLLAAYLF